MRYRDLVEDMAIPREYMPQIDIDDLENDYDLKRGTVSIEKLSVSQEERTEEKVDAIKKQIADGEGINPIIIDCNGYVVDGHHRYEAYMDLGYNRMPAIMVVNTTAPELIKRYQHTAEKE